jgi:GrpB-like predicted nucleotidyltransferase (UPF0157 family)
MSLCVAWRYEEGGQASVFLASDSCAVLWDEVMPYGGIKVLEIPVRIISATDATTRTAEQLFFGNYGMTFAGSYLSAFLLKELIAEVLSHLQFLGPAGAISFERICDLVHRIHKHFHERIRVHLKAGYETDFILGGFCPAAQKVRAAKFFVEPATTEPAMKEILQGNGFSFETVGNEEGQKRFRALMALSLSAPCRTHFAAFRRLWDIIRDPEYKFVTGTVQYGEFRANSFRLVGAFDLQCVDGYLKNRTFIRGTDLEEIHNPNDLNDFHVHYDYGNPFDDDINSFDVTRTYWEDDGTRHVVDEQVTVFPSEARWQQWFEEERDLLKIGIGDNVPIEHIGSTAVEGLASVPVIDILVGVEHLGEPRVAPFNLTLLKFEYLSDKLFPGHRFYRKRGLRAVNLLVVEHDGEIWNRHIAIRNFLRGSEAAKTAYSVEKMRILNIGSWTLVRYLGAKSGFMEKLAAKALSREK